jgi:hypothetical protein
MSGVVDTTKLAGIHGGGPHGGGGLGSTLRTAKESTRTIARHPHTVFAHHVQPVSKGTFRGEHLHAVAVTPVLLHGLPDGLAHTHHLLTVQHE